MPPQQHGPRPDPRLRHRTVDATMHDGDTHEVAGRARAETYSFLSFSDECAAEALGFFPGGHLWGNRVS